jgi:prepilin-type processing-associated H-X9-DG protein
VRRHEPHRSVEIGSGVGLHRVNADNEGGAVLAVAHLVALGHRRIAHWHPTAGQLHRRPAVERVPGGVRAARACRRGQPNRRRSCGNEAPRAAPRTPASDGVLHVQRSARLPRSGCHDWKLIDREATAENDTDRAWKQIRYRHSLGANLVFADGHVKWVRRGAVKLPWNWSITAERETDWVK